MPKSSYISNYKSLGISSSTTALSKDEAQETTSPEDPTNPASSFLTGSPSTTPTQQTWFEQSHNPLGIQAPQPHPVSRSSINPEVEMSAIGISKFEPNFEPPYDGGVQQSFAWPRGFDMGAGEQFLSQGQMSPPLAPASLAGFDQQQPLYARALTNSPPRTDLTPEQRELKRQRDVARRDTKVRMRRDRSTSNPYTVSPRPSPELLSRSLSDYSNTLAPSPLLSQSSQGSPELSTISAMSSPAYLSSYTPQLSDSGSSDLYGGVFSMPPQSFDQVPAYAMPYSTGPMDASLGAFIPRPQAHSMSSSDSSMLQSLYQNPSPKMGSLDSADHVRVVHSRPKPQCWEHGCNGRQFSTFSNLLRHQREKSGAASKSVCPNCGAEFTRTTARNGHMAHEKCKQKRQS